jgi:hypothetical protein
LANSLCAVLLLLVGQGAALGKGRVVVLNFAGPQGKKAQAAVVARVKKKYVIIPQAAFQKVAKQLRIRRPTDDDVANVARKLRADAIVAGIVQKTGRKKFELVITVRDGGSGTVIERVSIPLRGSKIDPAAGAKIESQLLPVLARAGGGGGAAETTTPVASENQPSSATPGKDDENPLEAKADKPKVDTPPPAQAVDDTTAGALGSKADKGAAPAGGADTGVTAKPQATGRPPWRPYATVGLGFSGMGRSLSFDGNSTMNLQGYSGGLVAALSLSAAFNPFAAKTGALRGLGLYLSLDKVLSVSSTLKRMGTADTSLDSSEQALALGVDYGYRLREAQDSATIGGRFGYGSTSFTITVPQNLMGVVTVPDVEYGFVEVGPYGRLPFEAGGSWWDADLFFAYLPVLSAGQITNGGRGMSIAAKANGAASGIEIAVGLVWHWKPWLDAKLSARLDRFSTSFDKGAAASSASDLFYNLGLGLSIVY